MPWRLGHAVAVFTMSPPTRVSYKPTPLVPLRVTTKRAGIAHAAEYLSPIGEEKLSSASTSLGVSAVTAQEPPTSAEKPIVTVSPSLMPGLPPASAAVARTNTHCPGLAVEGPGHASCGAAAAAPSHAIMPSASTPHTNPGAAAACSHSPERSGTICSSLSGQHEIAPPAPNVYFVNLFGISRTTTPHTVVSSTTLSATSGREGSTNARAGAAPSADQQSSVAFASHSPHVTPPPVEMSEWGPVRAPSSDLPSAARQQTTEPSGRRPQHTAAASSVPPPPSHTSCRAAGGGAPPGSSSGARLLELKHAMDQFESSAQMELLPDCATEM